MNQLHSRIPTSFGTVGTVARQVRQLLNATCLAEDANERPVAFLLANKNTGVLPEELDCRAWVYLEEDSDDNPVLVLAGAAGEVAVYLAVNLAERATVSALSAAVQKRQVEFFLAAVGGATSHSFYFSPSETKYVEDVLAEYLDLCPAYDPDWLDAFSAGVPCLPTMCAHLHPALEKCSRQTCIVLQGTYDNHLRAVRVALQRSIGI